MSVWIQGGAPSRFRKRRDRNYPFESREFSGSECLIARYRRYAVRVAGDGRVADNGVTISPPESTGAGYPLRSDWCREWSTTVADVADTLVLDLVAG